MKALVITHDANHCLTDHMIDCYQSLWPFNPFQFVVPYQEFPNQLENKYGNKIILKKAPRDVKGCLEVLISDLQDDEWVYWCIDNKYPEALNISQHEKAISWVTSINNKNIAGISLCRAQDWLKKEYLKDSFIRNNACQVFLERLDNRHIFLHQFVRVKVLRTLLTHFPNRPINTMRLDCLSPIIFNNDKERLFVLDTNRLMLAESIVDEKIPKNCFKSIQKKGIKFPESRQVGEVEVLIGSDVDNPVVKKSIRRHVEMVLFSAGIKMYNKNRNPNFLVIGAQKAGTTWLHKCLSLHSDISIPKEKELHYFDIEDRFKKSFKSYLKNFDPIKVSGELTPAYSTLDDRRVSYMKKLMPDLKLVLMLRNPMERAWSHAVMDLCTNQMRKVEDVPKVEFINHFNSRDSLLRGDYLRTIKIFRKHFGNQLMINYFTEISESPRNLIERILNHIGVHVEQQLLELMPLNMKIFSGGNNQIPLHYESTLEMIYRGKIIKLKNYLGQSELDW